MTHATTTLRSPRMTLYAGTTDRTEVGKPAYTMPTNRQEFQEVFPLLVQDLTNHCLQYGLPETALVWFRNVRINYSRLASCREGHSLLRVSANYPAVEPKPQYFRWQAQSRHLRCRYHLSPPRSPTHPGRILPVGRAGMDGRATTSLLPRRRRHHGCLTHASRSTVLVSDAQRWHDRDK